MINVARSVFLKDILRLKEYKRIDMMSDIFYVQCLKIIFTTITYGYDLTYTCICDFYRDQHRVSILTLIKTNITLRNKIKGIKLSPLSFFTHTCHMIRVWSGHYLKSI